MAEITFPFYPDEKIAIFVDGAYLYSVSRSLEFDIDYRRLLGWIGARGRLLCASYYTVIQEDQEYSPIRPLVDWLNYNGFRVVTKSIRDDGTQRRKRPDINIELAVDAMALADKVDHVMLFVGDSDFSHLIKNLQRSGIRVTVFGTTLASQTVTSDELRRHADHFIEMDNIVNEIGRDAVSDEIKGEDHLPEYIDA
jgi:uncharacterized LabA/DUF88 family protein